MTIDDTDFLSRAEALARIYVDELAQAKGASAHAMNRPKDAAVDEFLDAVIADEKQERLRVDLVLAAILTARCIAAEAQLAGRLRRGEDAVVVIETVNQEWVDLVEDVADCCATSRASSKKLVLARDGTERMHSPEKGNATIHKALGHGGPIIGIAPSPRRHLPAALLRTAEYRLVLPGLDGWAVRLLLEAMTGRKFHGEIDERIVRSCDISDLSLAFRRGLTPTECMSRLHEVVETKGDFSGDGPRLEELHGYGEAASWGLELVEDMKEYRAGRLRWDDVANRSLLLSSDPGLGKTSYALALARSLNAHLVSTSVAAWNAASYLSGTLQAMRDAFAEARRYAPSVLLIDEIDGISSRSSLTGDYVEYWTQLVNGLLELMSNTAELEGVVIIAATNNPEKIDPAVLRAGRLDKHIRIDRPGHDDLAKIFRYCLGPDTLVDADMTPLALAGAGCTGADVTTWVRRARAAARRRGVELSLDHLLAEIKGSAPTLPAAVRRRVAIHEAGHAVVAHELRLGTLKAMAMLHDGGKTEVEFDENQAADDARLGQMLAFLLGGRAAEQLLLGNCSSGSGGTNGYSDLERATDLAVQAESVFGFGQALGLVHVRIDQPAILAMMPTVMQAVRSRLDRAMAHAADILSVRQNDLLRLADELERRGYLSSEALSLLLAKGERGAADAA